MLIFAIDHNADVLKIKGGPTEEGLTKKGPPDGFERIIVRDLEGLTALDPALLLRIANYKSKTPFSELPATSDIWAMLSPPPKAKKDKKAQTNELTSSANSPSSSSPEGTPPPGKKQRRPKVAKAKKTMKGKNGAAKSTKAKSGNGAPRDGSKAAKLLELITRKEGATFAEMKKVTGWKEMRGTALTLARRVGKTLQMIKEEGKQPRWAAR